MKTFITTFILLLSSITTFAQVLHLDPEMTHEEYQFLLKKHDAQKNFYKKETTIEATIRYGERLNSWLAVINEARRPEMILKITTASNRGSGVPIEKPYVYSVKIVEDNIKALKASMPAQMVEVIFNNAPYTKELNINDSTFRDHARKLYSVYSMAARYKLLNPNREIFVGRERKDVRGYYYLTKNKIDAFALKEFNNFSEEKKEEIFEALIKICQNDWKSRKSCQKKVEDAIKKNNLTKFYNTYFPIAQKNWNTFFKISKDARRKDIVWSDTQASIPFTDPRNQAVKDFVFNNLTDEYRFKDWSLVLVFGAHGPDIKFIPGVTPHVNKLGGDHIVMDSYASLDEFDSQWTLRHEFGHVLGLPDCYHEFYDTKLEAFVNYQIDVTDLMCSRSGNMNERIYQELKKTYHR